MHCRPGCAACCIAISISSELPGMPQGKPAGLRCPHLEDDLRCGIWGRADYPTVCRRFTPDFEICGSSREEAMDLLAAWEEATRPEGLGDGKMTGPTQAAGADASSPECSSGNAGRVQANIRDISSGPSSAST
jgi:hypothetical protein